MVKIAAEGRPKLPLSRATADELRPAKYERSVSFFAQGNNISRPADKREERKSRGTGDFRRGHENIAKNNVDKPNINQSRLKKKPIKPVQPELSTFDELMIGASKINEKLEELSSISSEWEGHDKSEVRNQSAGLVKDSTGNWRDVDGALVETRSVAEVRTTTDIVNNNNSQWITFLTKLQQQYCRRRMRGTTLGRALKASSRTLKIVASRRRRCLLSIRKCWLIRQRRLTQL